MPKTLPITQIDAFTDRPFAGNPAAVVLDARGLSDAQMQAIAREMNLSETAFLTPAEAPGADYRLRWMTPTTEVNFCGHATVATVHALAEAGLLGEARVVFQARVGLITAAVEDGWIFLQPPVPNVRPAGQDAGEDVGEALEALGLSAADLAGWVAPALGGERDLLLPCRSLDVLRRAQPNHPRLCAIGRRRLWRAFCLTTLETFEPASSLHSRFFAPQSGVDEDPVTGSVHASLAVYVTGAGKAPDRFIAEQGDFLGRPGRLRLEVERQAPGAPPCRVRVGGHAVTVLRGDLLL
jgi:trans-2,3-dihydro-3-hydroxyanthranilate isomerase